MLLLPGCHQGVSSCLLGQIERDHLDRVVTDVVGNPPVLTQEDQELREEPLVGESDQQNAAGKPPRRLSGRAQPE